MYNKDLNSTIKYMISVCIMGEKMSRCEYFWLVVRSNKEIQKQNWTLNSFKLRKGGDHD